jgi:hypothetical protein
LSSTAWAVLAGLALAILGVAAYRFLASRRRPRKDRPPARPPAGPQGLDLPVPEENSASELWRKAQALAASGRHLEALRLVYLAVLFLLDRRRLLRYERTRTNGEYLRQLRRAEQAPAGLTPAFEQLTNLFEQSWYGAGSCTATGYRDGERLAAEVRDCAGPA